MLHILKSGNLEQFAKWKVNDNGMFRPWRLSSAVRQVSNC